ncbi:MAG: flavin reductase family protein [Hydrogenothermaceae bacterium]
MLEGFKTLEEGQYTLGYLPRPVSIVCVGDNPFAVSHHMLLSKDPFIYGFSCYNENYSRKIIEEVKDFSINFLPIKYAKDIHIVGKTHGNEVNKWNLVNLERIKGTAIKSSVITQSLLIYECVLEDIIKFYDHDLVVGRVIMKHYKKSKLSPSKVQYTLFMGKNFYTTNKKGWKLTVDEE